MMPHVDVAGGWKGWLKFTILYIYPCWLIAQLLWTLVFRLLFGGVAQVVKS